MFLRRFLTLPEYYPEMGSNEFYIAGESYAGIYIPTLAQEIVRGNVTHTRTLQFFAMYWSILMVCLWCQDAGELPINLVGLMIGNGCTGGDTPSCGQSPSASTFAESSGGHQLAMLHDRALRP